MKIEKTDVWLAVGLTAIFIVLAVTRNQRVIAARDVLWTLICVAAVCVYASAVVRERTPSLALSLAKVEVIVLLSQLLAFLAYLLTSGALRNHDRVAWLYFYPQLIVVGLLVAGVYPLCFWLCTRWRGR